MGGMKILVVDDERAVRESLRRALELEGYEIELAGDGREAIERLEREAEPDAIDANTKADARPAAMPTRMICIIFSCPARWSG